MLHSPTHIALRLATILLCAAAPITLHADDVAKLENAATQSAIKQIAPSVVQIQTVGGLDRAGGTLLGTGPTTGTILSADGYIISSAYNFAQKPASILVTLADGKRLPAKLVARDHSRMLVLLKVDAKALTTPTASPKKSLRAGQWAIAVGRSFDPKETNVSVGIVSAVDRIWGKAIQTDAKVSPNNYGGPLVDIHGHVQGILVPLNPQKSGATAGADWYDGGIGFAVPLEDILAVLPRLSKGEDLHSGRLGITLASGNDLFGAAPVLASARPRSPAAEAGLTKGDRIVDIEGHPIQTLANLRHTLAPKYAGSTIKITVVRGDKRKTVDVDLVAKLEPYTHPFLGILPFRAEGPAVVRFVYLDSPAAKAGLRKGDTILAANSEKIAGAEALRQQLSTLTPSDVLLLDIQRDKKNLQLKATLATLPEQLPPAAIGSKSPQAEGKAIGRVDIKIPEFAHKCFAYIPRGYETSRPHGVLVWLHPPGGHDEQRLIARWQDLCQQWNLILLAPKSSNPEKWTPGDAAFVRKALDQVIAKYSIDKNRIVVHGHEGGGAMAWLLALSQRDLVRGVAVVEAAIPRRASIPDNEPLERLAVYIGYGSKSTLTSRIRKNIEQLRENKFPVTVISLGELGRYLRTSELEDLCRWIDSLDRI
jgi:serine protease Do